MSIFLFGQGEDLELVGKVKKEVIPFKFIKNQLIIPVELNGYTLNFLVDSGLSETLLFSKFSETINIKSLRKVNLIGLGSQEEGTTGYYTSHNRIRFGKNYSSSNFNLILIPDEDFDLFNRFGIEIHGIVGYDFFKNYPVQIDYITKKIIIYRQLPRVNKYQYKELMFNRFNKPFFNLRY